MNALWVLSRATGLVSLVLLTLVVVLGIVVRRRAQVGRLPGFVLVGLHRNASLVAVALLVVHVVTVVADSYVSIRWWDAVVPFAGTYHPFWLGLGTLAVDLLAVLVLTSLVRHRMPVRAWRALHLTAYACWPIALVHGVGIGTDMRAAPGLAVAAGCALAGVGAVLWRLSAPRLDPAPARPAALLAELRAADARRPAEPVGSRRRA